MENPPVGQAVIAIILIAIISSTSRGAAFGEEFIDWVDESFASLDIEFSFAILGLTVSTIAIGFIILMVLASAVFWVMSRILKGEPSFAAIFAGMGFIAVVSIFAAVARLILGNVDEIALGIGTSSVISFASWIWYLALWVILVREANQFSTGRAAVAVFIPAIPAIAVLSAATIVTVVGMVS